jgi:hypothetical protein
MGQAYSVYSRMLGMLVLLFCTIAYVIALVAFASAGAPPAEQVVSFVQLAEFFTYPVVGSLIVTRRPSNTVGWIFCVIGLGTATTAFSAAYVQHALAVHVDAQLATGLIDALGSGMWIVNLGLGALLLLLFPDGKPFSRGWGLVFWLGVAAIAATSLADLLMPGPLEPGGRVINPLGVSAARHVLVAVDFLGHLVFLPLVLLAVASVIVRYRRAAGIQRQQIKWFALGAAAMALIIAVTVVAVPDQSSPLSTIGFAFAFAMLPLGAGIGVLRYRLYDIDVVINRTLVYGSLSAILAGVYFVAVVVMQQVVRAITGSIELNPVVVVLSTLLIAALSNPLRSRLQAFIDRRFYRAKYDTARTLERFAATLRQDVDLGELHARLVDVVWETLRPAHVSLWLRREV